MNDILSHIIKTLADFVDSPIGKIIAFLFTVAFFNIIKPLRRAFRRGNYIEDEISSNKAITHLRGYVPAKCQRIEPGEVANPKEQSEGVDPEFLQVYKSEGQTVEQTVLKKRLFGLMGYRWNRRNLDIASGKPVRILLFGGAGMGKTLTLYRLYHKIFSIRRAIFSRHPHVVLLSVKNWEDVDIPYEKDEMLNDLLKMGNTSARKKCTLLLDGFDEYCEKYGKNDAEANELITRLFDKLSGFQAVVIASRPLWDCYAREGVRTLYMWRFDEDQIKRSLRRFFLREFPYVLKFNPRYQDLKKRLFDDETRFLLDRICKRPMLLQYLDLLVRHPYYLTEEDFSEFHLLPKGFEYHQEYRWGKKEFLRWMDGFVGDLPYESRGKQANIKDWYQLVGRERLLDIAASKYKVLDSNARVYEHILLRWHGREAEKFSSELRLRRDYLALMAEVLPLIAGKMGGLLTISAKSVEKELQEKKVKYTFLYQEGKLKLNPLTRSVLKAYKSSGLGDRDVPNQKLRFVHKSFYEYYLAQFILNVDDWSIARLLLLKVQPGSEVWRFFQEMVRDLYPDAIGHDWQLEELNLPRLVAYLLQCANRQDIGGVTLRYGKDRYIPSGWSASEPLQNLKQVLLIESIYKASLVVYSKAHQQVLSLSGSLSLFVHEGILIERKGESCLEIMIFARGRWEIIQGYLKGLPLCKKKHLHEKLLEKESSSNDLMFAILLNSFTSVNLFVQQYEGDKNAWLEMQDAEGWTALMLACQSSSERMVRLLLSVFEGDRNAWFEVRRNDGMTALMIACQYGSMEMVGLLLNAYEGDKNGWLEMLDGAGGTVLISACRKGSEKMVGLLLATYKSDKNAWLEMQDKNGWTALMVACKGRSVWLIDLLLSAYKGNKNKLLEMQNSEGWTVLMVACRKGSVEMVELLLSAYEGESNTWLEMQQQESWTALMFACRKGSVEMVELLLSTYKGDKSTWLEMHNKSGGNALADAVGYRSGNRYWESEAKVYVYPYGYPRQFKLSQNASEEEKIIAARYEQECAEAIVRLLLDAGARPIPVGNFSVKSIAEANGHHLAARWLP